MSKSVYLANLHLDSVLGNSNFPGSLATGTVFGTGTTNRLYAALFNTLPAADGTGGIEVSGTSYARVAVTQNTTNWPAASAGSKSNGAAISFGTAGGSWGTVIGFGIYDASSGGNLLYFGRLTQNQAVASGDAFELPAGAVVVSES